jgi:tetratricopeptide (TPR) repeat protein
MKNDRGQPPGVKELFAEMLELPQAQRAAAVEASGAPDAVRAEVRSLLDAHESAERFLADPHLTVDRLATKFGRDVPAEIGPYCIIELLGQGGFGSVYLAEQEKPIKRRVAIKLIRAGADSAQVVARFEAERDALALMDHPNVARVLDAGTTTNGLPYFVMELVAGKAITTYCDERHLTTRERLALFRDVCAAVQHAHQKGVIHRDLKPSNVMVSDGDSVPMVKVIDFGVAKALHGSLRPALTLDRQFVGTPEYMSPEQAAGATDIDTRSDVYGLGVLLYELITGSPPFDPKELRHRAMDEIFRLIREVDPPRPSTRIASSVGSVELAKARGTDPAKLKTFLESELDWIVMCCLAKERDRRYDSAAALALDVERFLAGQAIAAHPPTRAYRLQKFARRYRVPILGAGLVLCSLLLGLALAIYGLHEAQLQRDAAERARRQEYNARIVAQQSNAFLREMFGSIDPTLAKGRTVSVREVLDEGALRLDGAFADQPSAEAAVRDIFAWAYQRIGDNERSQRQFDAAERLLTAVEDPTDPVRLSVLTGSGDTLHGLGRLDESEARLRDSVALHLQSMGEADPATCRARSALASVLMERAKYVEAREVISSNLDAITRAALKQNVPLDRFPSYFAARSLQAYVTCLLGEPVQAQSMFASLRKEIELARGADSVALTQVLLYQANVEHQLNRFGESRKFFEEAAALSEKVLGADHPRTLHIAKELSLVLASTGAPEEADRRLTGLLDLARKRFGEDHPFTLGVKTDQAILLTTWKHDQKAALQMYGELAEGWERTMGPDHPNTLGARAAMGLALIDLDRAAEAEPLLRTVVAKLEAGFGRDHTETTMARIRLAKSLLRLQRLEEAEEQFRIGYEAVKSQGKIRYSYHYGFAYGECLVKLERWKQAQPILEESRDTMLAFPKQSRSQMIALYTYLASIYDHTEQLEKAANARAQMEEWKATSRPTTKPAVPR